MRRTAVSNSCMRPDARAGRAARRAALTAGLLLPVALAHATASNKELEARANATDARVETLERSSRSIVELQQQLESARSELRTLRGQIEEAKHEVEMLRQQQRDLYSDLDRRLLLIENAAAGSAEDGGTPDEESVRASDETAVYADAFAALKAGRYPDAARGFQLYLTKYPDGPRADNAAFWLGESQYQQQDYATALKTYQGLLKSRPDTPKAADALLMSGYCQYELKAFRNARATLNRVTADYPGTEAARLAAERLARMDVEKR
jgi:tol-pal system protein YbgF